MEDRPTPIFSPEGAWWWSGTEWLPTLSPDRHWRWTGQTWVRWPWYLRLPKWFVRDVAVWVILLTAWIPAVAALAAVKASSSEFIAIGVPLGTIALASMLGLGFKLGRRSMWRELGLACMVGTAVMLAWYGAITIMAPDPTNQNDHAAAIGTVILAIPVLFAVGLIVALGGLVGRTTRGRQTTS